MKKQNCKAIENQIRSNVRIRHKNISLKNKNAYRYNTFNLMEAIELHNKKYRDDLIKVIEAIKSYSNTRNRPYLDFSKVERLNAMGMIHFKHSLDKYSKVVCKGRRSPDSIVSGMLSKLKIYERIGVDESVSDHALVESWYEFSGENADFGDDYDEIENILKEKFGEESETFDIVNTAIGEAVINVVNHAYSNEDKYKKWFLFLAIRPNICTVVISDLGLSIPKSIPTKVSDHVLSRFFNFDSWGNLKDDVKIEIATQYQKTATELPNRGKGFQDMKAVCDQIEGSVMLVHSRYGFWAKGNYEEEKRKKKNYKSAVNGTIISWHIPLENSSINVKSSEISN